MIQIVTSVASRAETVIGQACSSNFKRLGANPTREVRFAAPGETPKRKPSRRMRELFPGRAVPQSRAIFEAI